MPEGCIIGLSTAVLVVQNISKNRSRSSWMLYWSRVRPRCVMILVSVFLWSCVRSARLTKINASKFSPGGNACLCTCLRFFLDTVWMPPMPVHLTKEQLHEELLLRLLLLQLSCWSRSCSWRFCWTNRIASGLVTVASGSKSIQDSISLLPVSWNLVIHFWRSIVPRLYFMNCMKRYKNTFWAPLMKWGRRNLLK